MKTITMISIAAILTMTSLMGWADEIYSVGGQGFDIQKVKDNRGNLRLQISYYGPLNQQCQVGHMDQIQNCEISIYVRLNGRDTQGVLKMNGLAYYDGQQKKKVPYHSLILANYQAPHGSWIVFAPDLFYFAKNETGNLNVWDLELAVKDQSNQWDKDSAQNQNYKFRF